MSVQILSVAAISVHTPYGLLPVSWLDEQGIGWSWQTDGDQVMIEFDLTIAQERDMVLALSMSTG